MIKVLYIQQDGLITGSAISLMQMIKGFTPNTINPVVLFFSDGPAVKWFSEKGIETLIVKGHPFWTTPGPRFYKLGALINLRAFISNSVLKKVIKQIHPDIIHINDKAGMNAGITARNLNIPIIQHSRSTYYICNIPLFKKLSAYFINFYASHIIAISEDETDFLDSHKTNVIFNSIALEEIEQARKNKIQLDNSKIHIGWVGKFTTNKGAWDFLTVAKRILETFPNIQFHMLAPLPSASSSDFVNGKVINVQTYLTNFITENNLGNYVILHGYRKDFMQVMASFDVIINCNRLGAFGRQAFESLALGIPSVATCLKPGKSSILNNKIAMICEEGNLDEIYEATAAILTNQKLQKQLSTDGLKWGVNEFNPSIQSTKILTIYKNLLD